MIKRKYVTIISTQQDNFFVERKKRNKEWCARKVEFKIVKMIKNDFKKKWLLCNFTSTFWSAKRWLLCNIEKIFYWKRNICNKAKDEAAKKWLLCNFYKSNYCKEVTSLQHMQALLRKEVTALWKVQKFPGKFYKKSPLYMNWRVCHCIHFLLIPAFPALLLPLYCLNLVHAFFSLHNIRKYIKLDERNTWCFLRDYFLGFSLWIFQKTVVVDVHSLSRRFEFLVDRWLWKMVKEVSVFWDDDENENWWVTPVLEWVVFDGEGLGGGDKDMVGKNNMRTYHRSFLPSSAWKDARYPSPAPLLLRSFLILHLKSVFFENKDSDLTFIGVWLYVLCLGGVLIVLGTLLLRIFKHVKDHIKCEDEKKI